MTDTRTCKRTGLVLTAGPVSAFRIARESLGPFDPPVREGDDVGAWSRYDTVGRTIYASSDRLANGLTEGESHSAYSHERSKPLSRTA